MTQTASTQTLSHITFSTRPDHIRDNTAESISPYTHTSADQARDWAVKVATDMNRTLNRYIKWFRACHIYSTAVAATGIYNRPYDREDYSRTLREHGLSAGPQGKRPSDRSSDMLYSNARTLRVAMLTAGLGEGDPGRPHTLEGVDAVLAWAYAGLGIKRRIA